MLRSILVFLTVYLVYGLLRQLFSGARRRSPFNPSAGERPSAKKKKESEKDWGGTYVDYEEVEEDDPKD
ncbi:MAG: Uncharacterised protein [Flavobacteriia bacterium]|nr:MAG: Uncharacterised protein [Flavobacteriia bacterium]